MTFLEAKAELRKLAKGEYHSLEYQLTEYSNGRLEARCHLYIDPRISCVGDTWEETLNKMKIKLGIDISEIDLSEASGTEIIVEHT